MALLKLTLDTLPHLKGGLVGLMFERAIVRAVEDIESAPDIADARQVDLVIKLKPVLDQGKLSDIDVEFGIKGKVPTRSTSCRMVSRSDPNHPKRQMALYFQEDAPDNPFQPTLYDDDGDAIDDSPDADNDHAGAES